MWLTQNMSFWILFLANLITLKMVYLGNIIHLLLYYMFQWIRLCNLNYRDPKKFISTIFKFFINLSEDKSQSNIIPEAIHLCDGLMASGYPPELYCMLICCVHY